MDDTGALARVEALVELGRCSEAESMLARVLAVAALRPLGLLAIVVGVAFSVRRRTRLTRVFLTGSRNGG